MQVEIEYHIDMGDLGEQPIEVKADVSAGDHDAPTCLQGDQCDIWQVVVILAGVRVNITDECRTNAILWQALNDQVFETYHEAKQEAQMYRARTYRHIDCRV